jgi:P-type conjugative transfer protein TrbJ
VRKTLLATAAALSLLVATPTTNAQFAVIDPANLVQNVQQVFQAIEEGIRTLRQIELAVQTVTGIDLSLTAALTEQLVGVQTVLNNGAALVFQEAESLEQYRELFPEGFEALDTLEDVVDTLQRQNSQLLSASEQAVQLQSVSAEAIQATIASVEAALGESEAAVGQTAAIQSGNQLQGQIVTTLVEIQGAQLAAQRLQALEAANRASERQAAEDTVRRLADGEENANLRFPGVVPNGWTQ